MGHAGVQFGCHNILHVHGGNCHKKSKSKSTPSNRTPKSPSADPNGAIEGSKGKDSQSFIVISEKPLRSIADIFPYESGERRSFPIPEYEETKLSRRRVTCTCKRAA